MNASPNKAPAEKLTMYIKNFLSLSALIDIVTIPIREIKLTKNTLTNEYIHIDIIKRLLSNYL